MVIKDAGLHLWYEIDAAHQGEESCWIVDVDPTAAPPFDHKWKPFCSNPMPSVQLYKFAGGASSGDDKDERSDDGGDGHTSAGYLADDSGENLAGTVVETRSKDALNYPVQFPCSHLLFSATIRKNSLHQDGQLDVLVNNVSVELMTISAGVNGPIGPFDIPFVIAPGAVVDVKLTITGHDHTGEGEHADAVAVAAVLSLKA